MSEDVNSTIRKYSLKNASEYGKANLNSVIGKVLGENPDFRARANEIRSLASSIVDEVNKKSESDVDAELGK